MHPACVVAPIARFALAADHQYRDHPLLQAIATVHKGRARHSSCQYRGVLTEQQKAVDSVVPQGWRAALLFKPSVAAVDFKGTAAYVYGDGDGWDKPGSRPTGSGGPSAPAGRSKV